MRRKKMREIKFRAWDRVNKLFYFWGFNVDDSGAFWTGPPTIIGNSNHKNLIHEQYIGLHDRYKKRVFHNDIFEDVQGNKYRVDMSLIYKTLLINGDVGYEVKYLLSTVPGILEGEIIGNINENPELLEGGDR